MSKINFMELKRKEIRRTIGEGEFAIEIYNPSPEQQEIIKNLVFESVDRVSGKANISGKDILVKLIPILTNIYIDIDNDELVNEILKDPSEVLLEVVDEIENIATGIVKRLNKNFKTLADMPEEMLEEILKEIEENETKEELTEEELRIIEKAKRLKAI